MKLRHILLIGLALLVLGLDASAQSVDPLANSTPAPSGNPLTRIMRKKLVSMDMPLVEFTLKNREFPNFDFIYAPSGCWGISITNNDYVEGRLVISRLNDTIYDSGNYVSKTSGVRLKVRGNTSNYENGKKRPKPSYKIKLSKKGKLIDEEGVGKSKDWVLKGVTYNCPGYPYQIAQICGMGWQPQYQFVNLVINGSYFGVYFLSEGVTGDSDRVNIEDSGYIVENDPYWWKPDEVYFKSKHIPSQMGWTFKEPDTDDFNEMTMINIQWAIAVFENAIFTGDDVNKYIEMDTFAAWLLVHDIVATPDSGGANMFIVKDDFDVDDPFSSKLKMGPLWDLDIAMTSKSKDFSRIHKEGIFYFPHLFTRRDFTEMYTNMWNEILPTLYTDYIKGVKEMIRRNPAYEEARKLEHEYNGVVIPEDFGVETKQYQIWLLQRLRNLNYLINGTYELPNPPEDPGSIFDRPDPNGDHTLSDKDGGVIKYDLMGHPVKDNTPGITITRTTQTAKKQISQQ